MIVDTTTPGRGMQLLMEKPRIGNFAYRLTDEEAQARLKEHGLNKLAEPERRTAIQQFFDQSGKVR